MTVHAWGTKVSVRRALPLVALIGSTVWFGGSLRAQPDSEPENLRAIQAAMRAAVPASGATVSTDVTGQVDTVWGILGDFFIPGDYDGDGKADHAVWRVSPAPSQFLIRKSSDGGLMQVTLGQSGDNPTVVGDYDGDGKTDPAVYRSGATLGAFSQWIYRSSATGTVVTVTCTAVMNCGQFGDIKVPGDFNGDGRNDFMVQRAHAGGACPTDNTQGTPAPFIPNGDLLLVLNGATAHTVIPCIGKSSDLVVPGDYDDDGITDIAKVRGVGGQLEWSIRRSSTQTFLLQTWGNSASDFVTPADYDGDGKIDIAVWRITPAPSSFFVIPSAGTPAYQVPHGQSGDFPVANANAH